MMRCSGVLFVALALAGVSAGQGQGVLRITVTLRDDAQAVTPVARHTLFVSDNPATSEPRRLVTAADGTATIHLKPGSYIVESDRPVTFAGRRYQWTQVVEITGARDFTLALTADNAELVPVTAASPGAGPIAAERDLSSVVDKWENSVVELWSPTRRASGFLVDRRGLIATDQHAVGAASAVEVQLSQDVKVPARVLTSERPRDVAIVWIDPSVIGDRSPLPLPCPPASAPALDEGQTIITIEAPHQAEKSLEDGEVTALQPRRVETDLRLAFGGVGGPAFNEAGALVGLTSMPMDADARRMGDIAIVRTVFICDALAAALPSLTGAEAPEPTRLPVDPRQPYPAEALELSLKSTTVPPVLSSSDFDIAFLTPPLLHRAEQRTGRTGGTRTRSLEAEARLGRLTDFGAWSEYFANNPPVLVVRVTPKLVEGFWKRLGREAARTQGAVLPPFRDFKTSFRRLRATCGGEEIRPIHPLVLEHRVSEKIVIREGLYVFDPDAFGPHCATVTLSFYSDAQPEKADTVTVNRAVVDQIWQDFAPYRASARHFIGFGIQNAGSVARVSRGT